MANDRSSASPPVRLSWSGLTDRGRFRANNEDSFLALTFDGHQVHYLGKAGEAPMEGTDFVFAVSDGMGGARSGEFASRIAVERITRLMPKGFRLGADGMKAGFNDILTELFAEIHRDLTKMGHSYEECAGMGATLSLAWFSPGWMYFAHVGDSRIYSLPADGGFRQLTEDHSHVGWLRRTGKINEREARTHPRKNALNQALGGGHQFVEPQVGAVDCRPGDRFLICSDGLIEGLWDKRIEEFLQAPPASPLRAGLIVKEAVDASGRDNVTAIVIEVMPCTPSSSTAP